jgi:uncharacterized membrane protein
MSAATSHPLAAAYLRDLEMLLYGLDAGARAEVLTGVREHLSDALGPDASTDEVQAALGELGSPQSIADEAYADERAVPVAAPRPSRWQAIVACALNGAGAAYLLLLSWAGVSGIDFLALVPFFLLPWVGVVAALSTMSPVWTPGQKATSIALGPALLLCLALLSGVLLAVIGPSPVNAVPVLALFGASAWILFRLFRQALR